MVTGVLFICSGNIFRSYLAEACLQHLALMHDQSHTIKIASAGIKVDKTAVSPLVLSELAKRSIVPPVKCATPIDKSLAEGFDLIVGMARNHVAFIKQEFSKECILFNSLCYGVDTDVSDIGDVYPDFMSRSVTENSEFVRQTADHIYRGIEQAMGYFTGNNL